MTYDSQELLALFGRLFQHRTFTAAAMRANLPDDNPRGQRGQLRLLHLLGDQDGLTNAEIAEALDIRPSSVSALVKKLEEASFIERHDDPQDKRVSRIFVTEAGRNFLKGSRQFKDDFSEACFTTLSADEQNQLRDLLRKLLDGLNDTDDPQWQDLSRRAQNLHRNFDHFHGHPYGGDPFRQYR
ncbi:MarR family winged helix-turn-helix transcriptional regulator [Lacticaseibacillus sp. GG6-2]